MPITNVSWIFSMLKISKHHPTTKIHTLTWTCKCGLPIIKLKWDTLHMHQPLQRQPTSQRIPLPLLNLTNPIIPLLISGMFRPDFLSVFTVNYVSLKIYQFPIIRYN